MLPVPVEFDLSFLPRFRDEPPSVRFVLVLLTGEFAREDFWLDQPVAVLSLVVSLDLPFDPLVPAFSVSSDPITSVAPASLRSFQLSYSVMRVCLSPRATNSINVSMSM